MTLAKLFRVGCILAHDKAGDITKVLIGYQAYVGKLLLYDYGPDNRPQRRRGGSLPR
jgi:hypothetical protein